MAHLYVILSRTNTGVAKLIRVFTRNYYNHVSLSLNEDLSGIVSFARCCIDTPLHGGFVTEPAERFLHEGKPVPVRVFRVEISDEKAQKLEAFFQNAGKADNGLLYNHFAAFFTMLGLNCPVPGAYTCLSFVTTVLDKPYRTLQELEKALTPYEVFSGDLRKYHQDSGCRTDRFFTRRGFWGGTKDTLVHNLRLLARFARIRKFDDPVKKLR